MDFLQTTASYLSLQEQKELEIALEEEPTHGLFLRQDRMNAEDFLSLFPNVKRHPIVKNGFLYHKDEYEFGKHALFDLGAYYIQDPSAMVVASLLPNIDNGYILDMCAAPGGKSIGYALNHPTASILSNDISYPRAKELSRNVERMGLGNIAVTCGDFASAHTHYPDYFDAIILDAPCSGSAMFRKNASAREDWTFEKVIKNAHVQRELLGYAYFMLSPGGYLLYSTCSFSSEENQDQLLAFLNEHEDMEIVSVPDSPLYFHPKTLPESIYLLPHHFPGEGQFVALLHKKGTRPSHKEKAHNASSALKELINEYGLENADIIGKDDLYALNQPLRVQGVSLLRYGVRLEEEHKPAFALARYQGKAKAIPLTQGQARAYLKGETFALEGGNGFHIVSYEGLPLGYVKIVSNQAKNHYPKGYRRDYGADLFRLIQRD